MKITMFVVAWHAYGDWKATTPFETEKAAQAHADRYIMSSEHNGDKSYNKDVQIVPITVERAA